MEKKKTLNLAGTLFKNEDEPLYKKAMIIPYWHIKSTNTIQMYLKKQLDENSNTNNNNI